MGGLKKPLSLKGFFHLSFEPIHWLINIPYILASWQLGGFAWCKKHLSILDFNF